MAFSNILRPVLAFLSLLTLFHVSGVEGLFTGSKKIGDVTDFFQFRTRPDILAPRWEIKKHHAKDLAPGYWFVAPYKDLKATKRGHAWIGPHIYDQDGELGETPYSNHDTLKTYAD